MNRREFMRRMFGATVTLAINPTVFIPTPRLASDKLNLYGIPYHQSNASMGTWLGIERSTVPLFRSTVCEPTGRLSKETITAIQAMIKHIQEHG